MWDLTIENDVIVYLGAFAGNFSFLLAIVIGIMATYFVFRSARKMGGGLFGAVLNYVGSGMVFIVVGAATMALEPFSSGPWLDFARTVFLVLGFIFLVLGSEKLLKGITAN